MVLGLVFVPAADALYPSLSCLSLSTSTVVTPRTLRYVSIPCLVEQRLAACRAAVCEELDMAESDVELSMGMSSDFELAVRQRSLLCCLLWW